MHIIRNSYFYYLDVTFACLALLKYKFEIEDSSFREWNLCGTYVYSTILKINKKFSVILPFIKIYCEINF